MMMEIRVFVITDSLSNQSGEIMMTLTRFVYVERVLGISYKRCMRQNQTPTSSVIPEFMNLRKVIMTIYGGGLHQEVRFLTSEKYIYDGSHK
jgi:hypothetical protein